MKTSFGAEQKKKKKITGVPLFQELTLWLKGKSILGKYNMNQINSIDNKDSTQELKSTENGESEKTL